MRFIITIAILSALAGCSANTSGLAAPTHWRTYNGVPVAVVDGRAVLTPELRDALDLAGITGSDAYLRAYVLRRAE